MIKRGVLVINCSKIQNTCLLFFFYREYRGLKVGLLMLLLFSVTSERKEKGRKQLRKGGEKTKKGRTDRDCGLHFE